MKKTLSLFVFALITLSLIVVSCSLDPSASASKTPAIRGSVLIPSGSGLTGSDFYIRIMEGESAVYTGKVNADGSFVVDGLEKKKSYSILLTTEVPGEIRESSKDVSRTTNTRGYGGWLRNVSASENEQTGVGSVSVKPLGTIKGKVTRSGEENHGDIVVCIPETSYMAVTDDSGNFSLYNVPSEFCIRSLA